MAKIGVFDSGMGGLSVAKAIEAELPNDTVIFRDDRKHVPYGSKPRDEVLGYVLPILEGMVADGCDILVIACNTVTTTMIGTLRERLPVPLIGMEPMVKPAAEMTQSRIIAVCATPATLGSDRYTWLKQTYAPDVTVLEPDCSDWAAMIEEDRVDRNRIKELVDDVCDRGADVVVLGCTHYHWIQEIIDEEAKGRATVIQPESAVIRELARVLQLPPL